MGSVIYIKNILSKDELNLIWDYMKIFHASNKDYFDFHQTALGETHRYGDPLIESLLLSKKDIFEKNLKKELLPTYTFWRMYNKFQNSISILIDLHVKLQLVYLLIVIKIGHCL